MTEFQIYINGAWSIPPPSAMPVWNDPRMPYSAVVIYPQPAARDGAGFPIRTELELKCQLGRPIIDQAGQLYWYHTVGNDFPNGYVERSVWLYDPLSVAWHVYYGCVWKPTYSGGYPGSKVYDFIVNITNLVLIS